MPLQIHPEFVPDLVSVIVPTYNRAHLIGHALDSVLWQRYRPIEVIVVDDGSTDATAEIVEAWRRANRDPRLELILVREPNGGAPRARNKGLSLCRGEFIQFLDSDDVLAPGKIDLQVKALREHRDAMFAWSGFEFVPEAPTRDQLEQCSAASPFKPVPPEATPARIWQGIFRREACVAVGLWNETLPRYQDWDYSVRYTQQELPTVANDDVLYFAVAHSGGRIDDINSDLKLGLHSYAVAIDGVASEIGPSLARPAAKRVGLAAVSAMILAVSARDRASASKFMWAVRRYLPVGKLRFKAELLFAASRISGRAVAAWLARNRLQTKRRSARIAHRSSMAQGSP